MNCTNKYKNNTTRTFGSWRQSRRKGAYYPASILVDEPGMEAFDNELFGPVASVIRAKMTHAVELANNSQFGLGSGYLLKIRAGEKLAYNWKQEVVL
jgi:acyl-CoA reductase-like NAD-dependent aldehyde dehydrogenase